MASFGQYLKINWQQLEMKTPTCGIEASDAQVFEENTENRQGHKKFKLSSEELRALHECNRESFMYRCVPLGAIGMVSTHFAVKAGYLKGSAKFGSLWKVLAVGAVAYFAGKFSYKSKCEEKILQLPNSKLADMLRRRRKGISPFPEIYTIDPTYSGLEDDGSSYTGTVHSTPMEYSRGTWEIDSERNVEPQELDDSNRPTVDDNSMSTQDSFPNRSSISYDSLRQSNRNQFESKQATPYRQIRPSPTDERIRNIEPSKRNTTNQYGDSLD